MKNHVLFLVLVLFLLTTNCYLLTAKFYDGQVKSANTISQQTAVSAYIGYLGQYRFSIFGYSSPQALITLDGVGFNSQTYADKTGYFVFYDNFSPYYPYEACLTAQDQFGRLSQPTCLPPFPTGYNISIGPVILSPTISLDKNDYYRGDEVILSGQTIPNSDVNLSMFTKENSTSSFFSLIKPVEAFTIPQVQAKSDSQGNFSISLPSYKTEKYRLFAQTTYSNAPSAKSTTLNLSILPVWLIVFKILYLIFLLLKPRFIEIIMIVEIFALLIYILRRYFQPHMIAKNRALALRESLTLLEEEKTLKVREKYSLLP